VRKRIIVRPKAKDMFMGRAYQRLVAGVEPIQIVHHS